MMMCAVSASNSKSRCERQCADSLLCAIGNKTNAREMHRPMIRLMICKRRETSHEQRNNKSGAGDAQRAAFVAFAASDRTLAEHINLAHSPTRSFCHGIGFASEKWTRGEKRERRKMQGKINDVPNAKT